MSAPIVTWYRVEPAPRVDEIDTSLAAPVRDPLWFLTRQWQFGEFQGEDSGSPAYAVWSSKLTRFDAWRPGDHPQRDLPTNAPIESAITRERFAPDLSVRVELAHLFDALAREARVDEALVSAIHRAYALDASGPTGEDEAAAQLRVLVRDRAFDGVRLLEAVASDSIAIDAPTGDGEALLTSTLREFQRTAMDTYGPLGTDDPEAWNAYRLEYRADVLSSESGEALTLSVHPDRETRLEWHAFDIAARAGRAPVPERLRSAAIPGAVRFKGMPNARFWDFEDAVIDFGRLGGSRTELGRMIVAEFMISASNDWFMLPWQQPVGSLCEIEHLLVRDVFGGYTVVDRADRDEGGRADRWTLFSLDEQRGDGEAALANVHVVPATAASVRMSGEPIEDVRFLRDEVANSVWAIEHVLVDGTGQPVRESERLAALRLPAEPPAAPPTAPPREGSESAGTAGGEGSEPPRPLRYAMQTTVPRNWIPFVPLAGGDAELGRTDLVRARLLVDEVALPARAKVLNPREFAGRSYHVSREEIARSGLRVVRVPVRARWIDGSTHVWIERRRMAGRGEGSSGLRWDLGREEV